MSQCPNVPSLALCNVRLSKGLFYADVTHPASDQPLRIALHGVRTYEEAAKALSILSRLHATQSSVPPAQSRP